jgi:hypothetical protein
MKTRQAQKNEPSQDQGKKVRGRPTLANDERKNKILDGISKGTPLTVICREIGIADSTVRDWMGNDEIFSRDIASARILGFDAIAMEALRIADTPLEGIEHTDTPDGPRIKRADMLGHRKLQVETRLKLLAKWDPKRYGDMVRQEISGPDGAPIAQATVSLSPEQEGSLKDLVELARGKAKK